MYIRTTSYFSTYCKGITQAMRIVLGSSGEFSEWLDEFKFMAKRQKITDLESFSFFFMQIMLVYST